MLINLPLSQPVRMRCPVTCGACPSSKTCRDIYAACTTNIWKKMCLNNSQVNLTFFHHFYYSIPLFPLYFIPSGVSISSLNLLLWYLLLHLFQLFYAIFLTLPPLLPDIVFLTSYFISVLPPGKTRLSWVVWVVW